MADLARKKRVRGGHKASVTKMVRKAEELLEAEPPDVAHLLQIKMSLKEKLTVLERLDAEILELVDTEEDVTEEIEHSDVFKQDMYAALVKIEQLSQRRSTPDPSQSTPRSDPPSAAASKVKLPKLTIHAFDGEPTNWMTFWDSYKTAIGDNSSLTEIEKFSYLRSLLQGPALEAISGLALSAANYTQAVDILGKRFGNRQVIISRHMDVLMSMEPVISDRHLRDLRKLYDSAESHIRSLRSLGIEADSYGALLSPVLLAKLPPDLRLIVSRKVSDSNLNVDVLLETLELELTARERAAPQHTQPPKRNQERRTPPTASTLFSSPRESNADPHCLYCRQTHPSTSCTTVVDVAARKSILKSSGRCFNCQRKGHIARICKSSSRCQRCKGKHHTSICDTSSERVQPPSLVTPPTSGLSPGAAPFRPSQTTTNVCSSHSEVVFLQTARAVIQNPTDISISLEVRILFDGGSQRSYLTERARDLLHLDASAERSLSIATFGSFKSNKKVCPIVNVCLCLKGYPSTPLSLYVVPTICEPLAGQPITACVEIHPHLLGLELADSSNNDSSLPVDLLIGSDYYWGLVTGNVCRGAEGPTAIHTKLGWVLSGPSSHGDPQRHAMNLSITHVLHAEAGSESPCTLDEQLKTFWDLESVGVTVPDRSVLDEFQDKIRFTGERYEVSLPWKNPQQTLPVNYELSLRRLRGLLRRLRQNPEVLKEYDFIIQSQIQQGIVEYVDTTVKETDTSGRRTAERIHYLPHHAVIRHDKDTTKVRVVYDASARCGGPSLNDCLHTGPKFHQRMFDLLLRFRIHHVAFTADIEKAFLMIQMAEEDRDVLRFLWVGDLMEEQPEPVQLRFARVVFGVSSSPFLLNATIRHHLQQARAEAAVVEKLMKAFYVDDVVTGARNEEEAYSLYQIAKDILKKGGFNLRKFRTNSLMLQMAIDRQEATEPRTTSVTPKLTEADETYASITLRPSSEQLSGETRVLGIRWDISSDELVMSLEDIASIAIGLEPTKRSIVSLVGKIYDPLGILSPVVIRFKIFLQEMCEAQLSWDDPVTGDLQTKWQQLLQSLLACRQTIRVPRCYARLDPRHPSSYRLCGFCDASLKAYAAVVYLRREDIAGCQVDFVASKTRVSPLKRPTIPRLELLSALLLARLIASVAEALKEEMHVSQYSCFTDSTVALHWILGVDKNWKPFVHNRVAEIRRLLPPEHWAHCSGRDNPADPPSRGLTMQELADSELWLNGPTWLKDQLDSFPNPPMPEECLVEKKDHKPEMTSVLLTIDEPLGIGQIMKCEAFSSLRRLLSVTSQVLKFCQTLLRVVRTPDTTSCSIVDQAEVLWIGASQQALHTSKNFPQLKMQFGLFQDDNKLWRCGGRLQNTSLPLYTIHPILLDKNHHLTLLFIRQAHERVKHSGVKATLTELRSRFWIVKGRSIVQQILRRCSVCRRYEGRPYRVPPPPPLPSLRVEEVPAFAHTGVDFAGPLYVKNNHISEKVWICLFTCCVVRAVHLELVPNMTTPAFLRCLKRFVARRGLPSKVLSDNGKTFGAASKAVHAVVSHPDVQAYLTGLGVKWTFNLPRAPWWGGVFERMVKATKRCLRKTIGQAKLSFDELLTALTEVEAVINSRPLTYVSSDDLEEALTPSHLLVGRRLMSFPDHLCREPEDFEVTPDVLNRRARYFNCILMHFWKRWRREYLTELRESHRYHQGSADADPVSVGDVVVIYDKDQPRGFWRIGRVQERLTGRDGRVRGAILRVAKKERCTTLSRPLQLLYPLEVGMPGNPSEEEAVTAQDTPASNEGEDSVPTVLQEPRRRPMREAAKRARNNWRAWMQELQDEP